MEDRILNSITLLQLEYIEIIKKMSLLVLEIAIPFVFAFFLIILFKSFAEDV